MTPRSPGDRVRAEREAITLETELADIERRTQSPSTPRQQHALGVLVLAGVAALVWIAFPIGGGVLMGVLVGFSLQPLYERLRPRYQPWVAAFACTGATTIFIAGAVAGLGYLFVDRGIALVATVPELLGPDGSWRHLANHWGRVLEPLHITPADLSERLRGQAMALGSRAAGLAADILSLALHAVLTLFFMALTTYFILRHWDRLVRRAELLLPLHPRHTRALFLQLREVGRHVLLGTVLTGVAQGGLAAIGYWVTGVPQPAAFGVLTAVASLVPAVGTMLIWIPLGVYLVVTGHTTAGIVELVYGTAVVVGVSDYVLRPRLVGDADAVPALLTFVALFGGVEVFGLIGLVLGPVVVTLTVALLRTYYEEVVGTAGLRSDQTPLPPMR